MIVSFGLNTVGQEDEKELKATHALSESHNLIREAEIISAKLMPWGERCDFNSSSLVHMNYDRNFSFFTCQ